MKLCQTEGSVRTVLESVAFAVQRKMLNLNNQKSTNKRNLDVCLAELY